VKSENHEKSQTLAPGDLCVIVAHPQMGPAARVLVGRTVVLIELGTGFIAGLFPLEMLPGAPFWRVSGMPHASVISHIVLRKIPPDQMLDARSHMEPVEDKTPEKLHV